MKNVFVGFPEFMRLGALALGLGIQMHVFAGTEQSAPTSSLPALPADIAELKFRDFLVTPVGPSGMQINPALRSLDGRRVRILGYMARQENPGPGVFMLTPVPVDVTGTVDAMADELPPTTLVVHLPPAQAGHVAPYLPGLVVLTGTLRVGHHDEAIGRPPMVRLQLDAPSDTQAQLAR
jgi:hypothetical protein